MSSNKKHEISLQNAKEMTTRYRANRLSNFPVCETFEMKAIQKLLATPGCASLRVYYGMKENMEVHTIMVAVNANGADILPSVRSPFSSSEDEEIIIVEDGYRCPTLCPPDSHLNT